MKVILLLTFSLLFFSCGKKAKKTTTSLRISSGALTNGPSQSGGLLVMGKSRTHDQSFTLDGNATDTMVVELISGHWDFFAIGWQGNNGNVTVDKAFTGDVRCAFTQKVLEGAEDTISFDITLAKCSQPLPSPHDFYPHAPSLLVSNNIPKLTISTCQDLSTITPAAGDCNGTANEGIGKSFIVKTYFSLGPENGNQEPMGFIDSRCFNSNVTSELQIPLGDPNKDDGVPSFMIYSYPAANCAGDPIVFDFNGIAFGPKHQDQASELAIFGTEAWLFIEHNPTTVSDGGHEQNMFWGSGKDGNAISSTAFGGINEERVININAAGDVLTVPGGTATNFQPGDEIMWYVNDCANLGCNSGFKPGRFNFVHVKGNDGNNLVTLHKPIQDSHYGLLTLPTNTYLGTTIPNVNFTSMQIVKVFNFENLNLDADITAPTYSESLGKGGIRAFRVRDTMTANLTAQRFIKASGAGRDTNAVVDNSGCGQNTPCLFMGGNALGTPTERGGGILFVNAKNFDYSRNPNGNIFFKANGLAPTTSNQTFGGTLLAQFGTLIFDSANTGEPVNLTVTQFHANGDIGGGGGNLGGYAKFEYCFTEDPNSTGGSAPAPKTPSGNQSTVEVDSAPDYCDSL